jgi:exopolysaccharide biosynthesis protein
VIDRVRPTLSAVLGWGVWPMPWFETSGATSPIDWARAEDIVGGAGLIAARGVLIDDWSMEDMGDSFATTRHPRTVAGVDAEGFAWLLAIDGRQPGHSLGASFTALGALARHLRLVAAVNLDGGGSTTMVVQGRIVNRPSDLKGPRPVSDALAVLPR